VAGRVTEPFKAALALTLVVIVIGALTSTVLRSQYPWILAHLGTDLDSLEGGQLWTLPISTMVQSQADIKWHQPLLILLFAGFLEYQVGSLRMLLTFFLADWLSSILTVLVLALLAALGSSTAERLTHTPDMGSSSAAFASAAAGSVLLARPWRDVALAGLVLFFAAAFAFERLDVAIAHPIAGGIGACLAFAFWRRCRLRAIPLPLGGLHGKVSDRP
jgi:hypothetical protein